MRERKVVKLRVDMYQDTKFKIIDTMPERDLIHYVWTRLLTLAGKVNLEGDLYMSKTLPYTIETFAIEFNRTAEQIKLAIDVFMELEMIELSEDNIYRVKNFAKHQNIKVEEKIKSIDEEVKNKEIVVEEALKNEIYNKTDKESENKTSQNEVEVVKVDNISKEKINKRKKKEKIFNIAMKDLIEDEDIVSTYDYDEKKPVRDSEILIAS